MLSARAQGLCSRREHRAYALSRSIGCSARGVSFPTSTSGDGHASPQILYLQLRTRTRLIDQIDLDPYFNTHFTCIFSYLEFDNCSILQFFFHFVLVVFSTNNFCKPQQRQHLCDIALANFVTHLRVGYLETDISQCSDMSISLNAGRQSEERAQRPQQASADPVKYFIQ